ncbi:hypothetical protein [Chitiniphilus shinanonensis]|nr:hypothetical protein [Chitiniphilus shinanonensis]
MTKRYMKPALLATGLALVLTACGGGSGGGDSKPEEPSNPPTASGNISGVAAAGAPLAGTVTVKDANGVTRSVPVGADGQYTVDVTGLTPPFLFRADGMVGGKRYVIHSAALQADVGGNINITPLTDLIIANIAGDLAANFFDAPQFASLTPAAVTEQTAALKARLQSVLSALGIEDTIDLLRTSFQADHSGLDAALDILRVTVDPETQVATIRNVLTQEEIQDQLTSTTDNSALPAPGDLGGVVTDLQGIEAAFQRFNALFANGLPTADAVKAELSADFRHEDQNRDTFAADVSSDPTNIGISFSGMTLEGPVQTSAEGTFVRVGFVVKLKNGLLESMETGWRLQKVTTGDQTRWLLHGNRGRFSAEAYPLALRNEVNGAVSYHTGMEFWIEDPNTTNDRGVIAYALVKGPGLPAGGVRFVPQSVGGQFCLESAQQPCGTLVELPDSAIAQVKDNSVYAFEFYTTTGQQVAITDNSNAQYRTVIKRPYTGAELSQIAWPALDGATRSALASFAGGPFSVTASYPAGFAYGIDVSYGTASGFSERLDQWTYPSTATVTEGFDFDPAPAADPVTWRMVKLDYNDNQLRNVLSIYRFQQ